jgi:Fe-S-cluster containining protein
MRVKTETLRRGEKTESGMLRVRDKLGVFDHDPKMKLYGLGKQRIACPFLDNKKECVIYKRRPIICRIYGVPFRVRDGKKEKVYVCGFSGFLKGINYPTVKLDEIYHELYQLSKEVLTKANSTYLERAALMLSLPKVLKTPLEAIIKGDFVD